MTQVVPGILKATTAEGLILEAALFLQVLESRADYNPSKRNLVNVTIDTDGKMATITARVNIKFQVTSGNTNQFGTLTVVEYLASPAGAMANTNLTSINELTV